ncbi:MAG: gamma-glutamyltranspeptidase/glutathione hydrolase [Alcanivorax sp.]|jgi:gamma-glutamyltranspeptidase/glutathione hydrolase
MSFKFLLQLSAASLFAIVGSGAMAQAPDQPQTPIIDYQTRFLPVVAKHGMVVGPEKLASEVGTTILKQGGNAVDAAVATGFALAVTYPRAGNLGGGGFMLIHLAESNSQTLIDYRETAPAAASAAMFLDDDGEIDRMREFFSYQSAGVPGTVAGLIMALEKYGTMTLKEVLEPAIAIAEEGFPVSFALNYEFAARADRLRMNPEALRLFFHGDGSPYQIGEIWRQTDLAWTLKQISKSGLEGFYGGEVAQRIVIDMEANDGLMTLADLASYQAVERPPVIGQFHDFTVVSTPPPSSGGIHILQILNILEGYSLEDLGHNSAAYLHLLIESMKLAYADRSKYLGDPDFTPVPVTQLTSKTYAKQQRKRINENRATPATEISPGNIAPAESSDTTHYTVADSMGNVVSNTYTLNFSFGSHIAVPGTGMLLNNEMADFAASPGKPNAYGLIEGAANAVVGGKRPLSSMSPTMVFKDGKPWLATGSPGGSLIITTVLQTILNAMVFDMNIASAAAGARVHHQWLPDSLLVEDGISIDTIRLLEAMGHKPKTGNRTLGRTQSILLQDGWMMGATDTRRPGGWVAGF